MRHADACMGGKNVETNMSTCNNFALGILPRITSLELNSYAPVTVALVHDKDQVEDGLNSSELGCLQC